MREAATWCACVAWLSPTLCHHGPVGGSTTVLTVVAVAAAVLGVGVLVRLALRQGATTAVHVAAALLVAGATVFFGLVVLGSTGRLGFFGVAHLVYLAAVVTVPLIGLAALVARRRAKLTTAAAAIAVVLLLPAPVGVYATHIAPYRLRVERVPVRIDAARAGEEPVTVAVLSDLQTLGVGRHERAAVQAVLDADPDVILIPGDLFQGRYAQLQRAAPELRALLATLEAPGGVYFVEGDVDRAERMEALLAGTGIEVLDDQVVRVEVRDRVVLIGGTRKDYDTADAERVRSELAAAAGGEAITVLMSHRPDTVLLLPPSSGVDLTVAGHTHGGQIALPGIGPLVTLSGVPRHVGAGGLHQVDGNPIYVSPGVGMERGQAPQLRFGVPPTVAILELSG